MSQGTLAALPYLDLTQVDDIPISRAQVSQASSFSILCLATSFPQEPFAP